MENNCDHFVGLLHFKHSNEVQYINKSEIYFLDKKDNKMFRSFNYCPNCGEKLKLTYKELDDPLDECDNACGECDFCKEKKYKQNYKIDHPDYYGGDNTYECIKVIEAWRLGFHLGSVLKYICRAGKKDKKTQIEDLEKAMFYLKREIELCRKKYV